MTAVNSSELSALLARDNTTEEQEKKSRK